MINFILSTLSRLLFFLISPLNFIYVVFIKERFKLSRLSGYWRSDAVGIDRYGNYNFRSLFNRCLIQPNGYQFGDFRETVSSVLGKNQRDNTLTKSGKNLVKVLDKIDKNHCQNSINEFETDEYIDGTGFDEFQVFRKVK